MHGSRRQKWVKKLKRWWMNSLLWMYVVQQHPNLPPSTKTWELTSDDIANENTHKIYRSLHWWCAIMEASYHRPKWLIKVRGDELCSILSILTSSSTHKSRDYLCWWFTPKQTCKLWTSALVMCNYYVWVTKVNEETLHDVMNCMVYMLVCTQVCIGFMRSFLQLSKSCSGSLRGLRGPVQSSWHSRACEGGVQSLAPLALASHGHNTPPLD